MNKQIVVLFHEGDKHKDLSRYSITHLARTWAEDGNKVLFAFGTKHFVPADIIVVHVDLSVVPEDYLQFARRYPRSVNSGVWNITKRVISRHLVSHDDSYEGKVIVKSNDNYAGQPERWVGIRKNHFTEFRSPQDYPIYKTLREVPGFYFESPEYVVEKFLPEIRDGLFMVRLYQFLGDHENCFSMAGKHPIVNASTCLRSEVLDVHPEIRTLRHEMKYDYGKLDYVINDGKVVLLDANKTTGYWAPNDMNKQLDLPGLYRERARGLYAYFS